MTTQWIISNNLAVLNNPKTQVWLERHFFSWWVGGFPHIFRVKVLRWVCSKRLRTRSQSCGLVIFLVLSGQLRWGSPGEEGGVRQRAHKVHIFWEGHKILRNLHLTFDYSTYSPKVRWRRGLELYNVYHMIFCLKSFLDRFSNEGERDTQSFQ